MNEHEKVNYVEFPAKDILATKKFLAEVFAWSFDDFGPDYCAFSNAGIDGGFYKSELCSTAEAGGALVVFYSEDLESTLLKIENAGGNIVKHIFSFPGGRRFHFTEPSGNEFAVWSDLKPQRSPVVHSSADWKEDVEYIEDIQIDVGFTVADSFYHGPDNDFTESQYQEMRVPLYQPSFERFRNFALSRHIKGKESELLTHYRDVVEKHAQYKKDINLSTYFWNRPFIFKGENVHLSFPWYDNFRAGKFVLDRLASISSGEVFSGLDQGWELEIFADNDLLYARQRDFDTGKIYSQIVFDRAPICDSAARLVPIVSELIEFLSAGLDKDYWS